MKASAHKPLSLQEQIDYRAGERCTLNGRPAKLIGRLNEFATVATLDCLMAIEYAWPTALRIMERNGKFKA